MKEAKKMLIGVFLLNLLLLAYSVLITVRLHQLEASRQESQWRYRVFSNTLAHAEMTPELAASLSAVMAQEARRLPRASGQTVDFHSGSSNSVR
jgi:hypothetical protein